MRCTTGWILALIGAWSLACGGSVPVDGTSYFQVVPLPGERCGPPPTPGPSRRLRIYMHRGEGVSEVQVSRITRQISSYWAPYGLVLEGHGYPNPEPFPQMLESKAPFPEALMALRNSFSTWKKDGLQLLVVKTLDPGTHPELNAEIAVGLSQKLSEDP